MAEIDPGQVGRAGAVRRRLVPLGGVKLAGAEVAGVVGDEHEEADIRAVVGDVGRLLVWHDLGEFDRDPAHGVVLGDGVGAVLFHGDFRRIAVGDTG